MNSAIKSTVSTCPMNMALQQYLSRPRSSITFFLSSPFSTRFLYSSLSWAIGFPHPKHLIGMIIFIYLWYDLYLYDFCFLLLALPWVFGFLCSFVRQSATNNCLSYFKNFSFNFPRVTNSLFIFLITLSILGYILIIFSTSNTTVVDDYSSFDVEQVDY